MDSLAARLLLSELWLLMLEIRRGASNFMSNSDNCISTFGTFLMVYIIVCNNILHASIVCVWFRVWSNVCGFELHINLLLPLCLQLGTYIVLWMWQITHS